MRTSQYLHPNPNHLPPRQPRPRCVPPGGAAAPYRRGILAVAVPVVVPRPTGVLGVAGAVAAVAPGVVSVAIVARRVRRYCPRVRAPVAGR
jgi:hypothetical protein